MCSSFGTGTIFSIRDSPHVSFNKSVLRRPILVENYSKENNGHSVSCVVITGCTTQETVCSAVDRTDMALVSPDFGYSKQNNTPQKILNLSSNE